MRVMSRPSKMMAPELAGVTPQTVLTSVVLPAPFGPIRPSTSPLPTENVTSRSACRPLNRRDTALRRRISDMLCLSPEAGDAQRNNPVRQQQQKRHDQQPQYAAVNLDIVAPDHLLEREIKQGAAERAERRSQTAHQGHHKGLDRIQNVEDVGRIDIMHPRRIDAA